MLRWLWRVSDHPIKGPENADVTGRLQDGLDAATPNLIGQSNSFIATYFKLKKKRQNCRVWRSQGRFLWPWQHMMAEIWLDKSSKINIHWWKQRSQEKHYEVKRIQEIN